MVSYCNLLISAYMCTLHVYIYMYAVIFSMVKQKFPGNFTLEQS